MIPSVGKKAVVEPITDKGCRRRTIWLASDYSVKPTDDEYFVTVQLKSDYFAEATIGER